MAFILMQLLLGVQFVLYGIVYPTFNEDRQKRQRRLEELPVARSRPSHNGSIHCMLACLIRQHFSHRAP